MFIHSFKYTLKTLFKNKSLIFWTFAFPLVLATFFYMAFSNLTESEKMDIIDIAVVDNEEFGNNEILKGALKELSSSDNEDRIFNTRYTSSAEATDLLSNKEIVGYLEVDDDKVDLTVSSNGLDETVFKLAINQILEQSKMIETLTKEKVEKELANGNKLIDYEKLIELVQKEVNESNNYTKDMSKNNLDYSMIEFYTLIAMTCMYSGILSMVAINNILPNMGVKGKRVNVSPAKKSVMILSSLSASYIVQIIGLILLFLYTYFILNVNYGDSILYVIILALIGSLAGLSLGLFVGSCLKKNENTKTGILLALSMLGCFFSGMFGVTMKYVVDTNVPLINKINPVSMITDGLYSLYYYGYSNRYIVSIISLFIFSLILIIISAISLRRQKYDSI